MDERTIGKQTANKQTPDKQTANEQRVRAYFDTKNPKGAGRYAPSPTGELHAGNLRTALLAWAWARATDRAFYMRVEDLDRSRYRSTSQQLDDLRKIGLEWDGEPLVQSERLQVYEDALGKLKEDGLVFECYCSRKDIREAVSASHGTPGKYPGTCLNLSRSKRDERRKRLAEQGRRPALRFLPSHDSWTITDVLHGEYTGDVDNVVLQRGDGAFAYNLAVAVDDHLMGVDQVVRGDDLLSSAPVHSHIRSALSAHYPSPSGDEHNYVHVPLVLGPTGERLAKRDGAVTLADLEAEGVSVAELTGIIGESLNLGEVTTPKGFLKQFEEAKGIVNPSPWQFKKMEESAPVGKASK